MLWYPFPFSQPAAKPYQCIVTSGGPTPGTSDFAVCARHGAQNHQPCQVRGVILAAVPSTMEEQEVGKKKSLLAEHLEDMLNANRQKTSFPDRARKAIL